MEDMADGGGAGGGNGTDRALVLGGGGLAGIAWQTGMLLGLAEGGVAVTRFDLVVGTSAGSTVAAQLGSGESPAQLFARQTEPHRQAEEVRPPEASGVAQLLEMLTQLNARDGNPGELRRRIGELALAADTMPEPVRRAVIAGRLPSHDWPDWPLWVVAVDAASGAPRIFERGTGVDLVDAVAASSAVPGVWPPVSIAGARYLDGGVRSLSNVDLAHGFRRILLLAPLLEPTALDGSARDQVLALTPDDASLQAFGTDLLDPAVRAPSARAGHAQGRRHAADVAAHWN
jgi:NTE family protein